MDFLDTIQLFFIRLGNPAICVYQLLINNPFLNVAADDAQGLEKIANDILAPLHYLIEGKKAVSCEENDTLVYHFERRFDYKDHFFLKGAVSITALPLSLSLGLPLKGAAYLFNDAKERYERILTALSSTKVVSNYKLYESLGIQMGDFSQAEWIDPPEHKRRPQDDRCLEKEREIFAQMVAILDKHQIPFWMDCGTCLGTYRYGGVIPWDLDIDISALRPDFNNILNALKELDKEKCAVFDFSGRDHPQSYIRVLVKETGLLLDIYFFDIDLEKKIVHSICSNEFNMFLSDTWKVRERRFTKPMPYDRVFPLKKAHFEGIEVRVPNKIREYLQTYYGENLAPARVYSEETGQFEKDLSHPYWKLPGVY